MRPKLAVAVDVLGQERDNRVLGAVYILLLTLMLGAYLFMALLPKEGYNPGLYRNAYMYFMIFDLALFSLLIPFWETGACPRAGVKEGLRCLAGVVILAASPAPLFMALFTAGMVSPVNFLPPLLLKTVWGLAVLSWRECLGALKPGWRWNGLLVGLFIFGVLALGGLLALFTVDYHQAVITTLYDRDIPWWFFANPLLALEGAVYFQAGGGSQMGLAPLYGCACFWLLVSAVLYFVTVKYRFAPERGVLHE